MGRTLLIGTTKGLFLMDLDGGDITGPHCGGWGINHAVADPETGTIWAGGGGDFFGGGVWRSSDSGTGWDLTRLSCDEVEALTACPGRAGWNPGAVGLTLHTLVTDPADAAKLWVGISAAGVFATEDGGARWDRRSRLSNAGSCEGHDHPAAPSDSTVGGCVHHMVRASGDVLYQQNHHGVWRSGDGDRSWHDITAGLPSTFGFPIGVDPDDPGTIWTIPRNGESAGRFPWEASAAVWRSTDGGAHWEKLQTGLPKRNCYFTVLRQAMATAPGRVWFGTNTGSIFASRNRGDSWDEIARHLPTIQSVEIAQIG